MLKILFIASLALNVILILACLRLYQTKSWWQQRGRRVEDYVDALRVQLDDFYKEEMRTNLTDEQRQFASAVKHALGSGPKSSS